MQQHHQYWYHNPLTRKELIHRIRKRLIPPLSSCDLIWGWVYCIRCCPSLVSSEQPIHRLTFLASGFTNLAEPLYLSMMSSQGIQFQLLIQITSDKLCTYSSMRKVHTKIYSCPWKSFRVEIDSRLHSSDRSFEKQLHEKNLSWSFNGDNRDWIGIHAISNTWRRNWWGLILSQYVRRCGGHGEREHTYCMYVHHD